MSLPKDIQQLLDSVVNTLVKWDLIAYLHKNPSARISAEKIASSIGRSADEVLAALSELSDNKILQYEYDGETLYYRYNPDREWQSKVDKFIDGLSNRNTRWLILNYLVEKDQ